MRLRLERIATPIGAMLLVTDADGAVRALHFADPEPDLHRMLQRHYGAHRLENGPAPKSVSGALAAYFKGDLTSIAEIRVSTGGTMFQERVWAGLRTIPAGETMSYGGLAAKLGQPRASRAVGLANHLNPVALIVPCHRVIGANGTLTGYASGLERKRWLLDHERRRHEEDLFAAYGTPARRRAGKPA